MTFERLTPAIGAVVAGVDLTDELSDTDVDVVRALLLEHQVLFFRDQDLSDEQHLRLASRFGAPLVYPNARAVGSTDPLTLITASPDKPPQPDTWHTDLSWLELPPEIALLSARTVPQTGGDTLWASLYALHDSLSSQLAEFCTSLTVRHEPEQTRGRMALSHERLEQLEAEAPGAVHPLIGVHPETKKRTLYISGDVFMRRIVELSSSESTMLLHHFRRMLDDPNNYVRWRWRSNDLAVWDERSTNHRALGDYFPSHRSMRRCVVTGESPFISPLASQGA